MKTWLYVLTTMARFTLTMLLGAIILVSAQSLGMLPFGVPEQPTPDSMVVLWFQPGMFYMLAALFTIFLIVVNRSLSRRLGHELGYK